MESRYPHFFSDKKNLNCIIYPSWCTQKYAGTKKMNVLKSSELPYKQLYRVVIYSSYLQLKDYATQVWI